MARQIRVHLLPNLIDPHESTGNTFVVIDVLRASTTIVQALKSGVKVITPCLEVAEARELAARQTSPVLLGGERAGKPIAGFDLGNSPAEYTRDRVGGRRLVFTTTNGTRAMKRCLGAERILIGSFINLSAIVAAIQESERVELICAGTDGEVTREDVLFAGAIVSRLTSSPIETNDSGRLALDAWNNIGGDQLSPVELTEELRASQGGQNLIQIGMDADIRLAAEIDAATIVPRLEISTWEISAESQLA